eukprot:TRINITY_DN13219_c0_g1_i1.p1 TRINITY_DN13219_c0_g1~~TRINITY_DN13219_c0_g1_i1.p1  ORF type:complete len:1462 (+),score=394.33 TRINITY_DN13219_c0_g1_i1:67-4452(+)
MASEEGAAAEYSAEAGTSKCAAGTKYGAAGADAADKAKAVHLAGQAARAPCPPDWRNSASDRPAWHRLRLRDSVIAAELFSGGTLRVLVTLTLFAAAAGCAADTIVVVLGWRTRELTHAPNATDCGSDCEDGYCCCWRPNQVTNGTVVWKAWQWAPTMGITVYQEDVEDDLEVVVSAKWTAAVGAPRNALVVWDIGPDSDMPQVDVPQRVGVRISPGKPVSVMMSMSLTDSAPQEARLDCSNFYAELYGQPRAYITAASVVGCIFLSSTLATIPMHLWRLRRRAGALHPALPHITALLFLLCLYTLPVACLSALPEAQSSGAGWLLGLWVYQLPYIFLFYLQGFLLVRVGALHPSCGPSEFKRVHVPWVVGNTAIAVVYATWVRPDDLADVVGDGAYDAWMGVGDADQSNLPGYVLGELFFAGQLAWLAATLYRLYRVRNAYKYEPALLVRHRLVELRVLAVAVLLTAVIQVSGVAPQVEGRSPLGPASLGGMVQYFTAVHFLAFCYQPAFKAGDETLPPPPQIGSWKRVRWRRQWLRWAATAPGARSLYHFASVAEEQRWWQLQQREGNETDSHVCDDEPLPAMRDFCTTVSRLLVLFVSVVTTPVLFGLTVASLSVSVLLLPLGIGLPLTYCSAYFWRFAAFGHAAMIGNASRGMCSGRSANDTARFTDVVEGTWSGVILSAATWRSVGYLLVAMPASVLLFVPSVTISCIAFGVSACVVTLPVGVPLLRLAARVVDVAVSGADVVGSAVLGAPQHRTLPDATPLVRRYNQVRFHPFCFERCCQLAAAAYESYRQVPDFIGLDASDAGIGWVPGKDWGSAGTVARNVPLSAQTERAVDPSRYGLTLRCAAHICGVQVLFLWPPDSESLIIAFRGTKSYANKRTDLEMRRGPWDDDPRAGGLPNSVFVCGCCVGTPHVHRGFGQLWSSMRDHVLATAARHMPPGARRVFVTGHSLGAAMATLCAHTVATQCWGSTTGPFEAQVGAYCFGTPLLGNTAFASALQTAVPHLYQVVNENDAITRGACTIGNRHPGHRVLVGRFGQMLITPSGPEQWWHPWRSALATDLDPGFAAHRIVRYQAALSTQAAIMGVPLVVPVGEEDPTTDAVAWVPDTTGLLFSRQTLWSVVVLNAAAGLSLCGMIVATVLLAVSLPLSILGVGLPLAACGLRVCLLLQRLQVRLLTDERAAPLTELPVYERWWHVLRSRQALLSQAYLMVVGFPAAFATAMVVNVPLLFALALAPVPLPGARVPLKLVSTMAQRAVALLRGLAESVLSGCGQHPTRRTEDASVRATTSGEEDSGSTSAMLPLPQSKPAWLCLGSEVELIRPTVSMPVGTRGRVVKASRSGVEWHARIRFAAGPAEDVPAYCLRCPLVPPTEEVRSPGVLKGRPADYERLVVHRAGRLQHRCGRSTGGDRSAGGDSAGGARSSECAGSSSPTHSPPSPDGTGYGPQFGPPPPLCGS